MVFRILLGSALLVSIASAPATANKSAHFMSTAGQPPAVWDHEPGPNDRMDRFQTVLVDDRTCPIGQIKRFTTGSKALGVRATRECVAR